MSSSLSSSPDHGALSAMEVMLSLASLTVTKVLQFSGLLSDNRNVVRSRNMEEKALEVYGEETADGRLNYLTDLFD